MAADIKEIKLSTSKKALRKEIVEVIQSEKEKGCGLDPDDPFYAIPPKKAEERDYWWAWRCLRVWPVKPAPNGNLMETIGEFINGILKMDGDKICEADIDTVRQVKNPTKARIKDEVLIVFKETTMRDNVARRAPGLAHTAEIGGLRP